MPLCPLEITCVKPSPNTCTDPPGDEVEDPRVCSTPSKWERRLVKNVPSKTGALANGDEVCLLQLFLDPMLPVGADELRFVLPRQALCERAWDQVRLRIPWREAQGVG